MLTMEIMFCLGGSTLFVYILHLYESKCSRLTWTKKDLVEARETSWVLFLNGRNMVNKKFQYKIISENKSQFKL